MRRVVLDTSVVASAFRGRQGASFQLLVALRARRLVAIATTSLLLEYEDVLKRLAQRAVSGLALSDVDAILSAMARLMEPVEVRMSWRPQLKDANDELVLEAAINGRATAIVTHNLRDFRGVARQFRIVAQRPADTLRDLG